MQMLFHVLGAGVRIGEGPYELANLNQQAQPGASGGSWSRVSQAACRAAMPR
ncbi:hypothetical protein ACH4OW_31775 [Streptomyces sp. NPDC017056]|uniref:hypothetical protein n=1 Tax=Streptomyces sp. NPDC017056 TaxID=3364973 RepID=UPI00379FC315